MLRLWRPGPGCRASRGQRLADHFAPPERRLYRLLDGEDAVEVVRWKDVRSELDAAIDATSQVAEVLTAVTLKI